MKAPPRRIVAPAALTASAVSNSCSLLSTEHGPAITVSDPSPMTASRTRMTVSSGWNSRDVSLYGRLIGVTEATPGRRRELLEEGRPARTDLADDRDDRPLRPDMVERRQALGQDPALDAEDLGLAGADGHHDEHRARVSSVGRPNKKAEVWPLLRLPDTTRAPGPSDRERSCRASKIEVGVHVRSRTVSIAALDVNARGASSRSASARAMMPSTTSPLASA